MYLINKGAKICNYGFICAVGLNHIDIVKYLIDNGANIHEGNDVAIKVASKHGYLEIFKYLVFAGLDPHVNNNEPLKIAIQHNQRNIIDYINNM